jgi:3-oxo-5-alpha-steroid 4-dehydrogenase 1
MRVLPSWYTWIIAGEIAGALVILLWLSFMAAPYGRHAAQKPIAPLPARVGWLVMEAPAPLVFAATFFRGARAPDAAAWALFVLWQIHYLHRAFVFPFRVRGTPKPMPAPIALTGAAYNVLNGWLCASYLVTYGPARGAAWRGDARFVAGACLFALGLVVNLHSDTVLLALRAPGESGYRIPRGGAFRWVTSPNYLGEIVEWIGFAIASWSPAALAFALWTIGNLVPRAFAHHRWYREKFPDYPRERKALVPFVA